MTEQNEMCSICREPMAIPTAKISSCGHIYHRSCLEKWIKIKNNCPMCRCEFHSFKVGEETIEVGKKKIF